MNNVKQKDIFEIEAQVLKKLPKTCFTSTKLNKEYIVSRNLFMFNLFRNNNYPKQFLIMSLFLDTNLIKEKLEKFDIKEEKLEITQEEINLLSNKSKFYVKYDIEYLDTKFSKKMYFALALYKAKKEVDCNLFRRIEGFILPEIKSPYLKNYFEYTLDKVIPEIILDENLLDKLANKYEFNVKKVSEQSMIISSLLDEWYVFLEGDRFQQSLNIKHMKKLDKTYHKQTQAYSLSDVFRYIEKHNRYVLGGRKYFSNKMSKIYSKISCA